MDILKKSKQTVEWIYEHPNVAYGIVFASLILALAHPCVTLHKQKNNTSPWKGQTVYAVTTILFVLFGIAVLLILRLFRVKKTRPLL